jgi:hypothetical protein
MHSDLTPQCCRIMRTNWSRADRLCGLSGNLQNSAERSPSFSPRTARAPARGNDLCALAMVVTFAGIAVSSCHTGKRPRRTPWHYAFQRRSSRPSHDCDRVATGIPDSGTLDCSCRPDRVLPTDPPRERYGDVLATRRHDVTSGPAPVRFCASSPQIRAVCGEPASLHRSTTITGSPHSGQLLPDTPLERLGSGRLNGVVKFSRG